MSQEAKVETIVNQSPEYESPPEKNASKAKGWVIAGASLAVLWSIAYWKARDDDQGYL